MKKMLFIVNPNAGKGSASKDIFRVIDIFIKNGYEISVYFTQKAGELPDILCEKASQYDCITVYGGDGTLNEAINGLARSNVHPTIGYIPKGTVNDFASSLSIPKDAVKAAENICKGKPISCDIGCFNGRYYTYVAAFGAFTEVSYATSQSKKKIFSRLAYIFEGIKAFFKIKKIHCKVEYNGNVIEDDFIYAMASNTKSVGGFKIPDFTVDMSDGKLEILLVKSPKGLSQWLGLITSLLAQKLSSPLIKKFSAEKVVFIPEENTGWTIDGEFGGTPDKVEICAVQKVLNIIVIPQ